MYEVWNIKRDRDETRVHRLEDQSTLGAAVCLAASTGPGNYQISDNYGPLLDVRVHVTHEPAVLPIKRVVT